VTPPLSERSCGSGGITPERAAALFCEQLAWQDACREERATKKRLEADPDGLVFVEHRAQQWVTGLRHSTPPPLVANPFEEDWDTWRWSHTADPLWDAQCMRPPVPSRPRYRAPEQRVLFQPRRERPPAIDVGAASSCSSGRDHSLAARARRRLSSAPVSSRRGPRPVSDAGTSSACDGFSDGRPQVDGVVSAPSSPRSSRCSTPKGRSRGGCTGSTVAVVGGPDAQRRLSDADNGYSRPVPRAPAGHMPHAPAVRRRIGGSLNLAPASAHGNTGFQEPIIVGPLSVTGGTMKNNHRLDHTADFGCSQDHALSTALVARPSTPGSRERNPFSASTVRTTGAKAR